MQRYVNIQSTGKYCLCSVQISLYIFRMCQHQCMYTKWMGPEMVVRQRPIRPNVSWKRIWKIRPRRALRRPNLKRFHVSLTAFPAAWNCVPSASRTCDWWWKQSAYVDGYCCCCDYWRYWRCCSCWAALWRRGLLGWAAWRCTWYPVPFPLQRRILRRKCNNIFGPVHDLRLLEPDTLIHSREKNRKSQWMGAGLFLGSLNSHILWVYYQ